MQKRCWFTRLPLPPLHHHGLQSTLGVHAQVPYLSVETLTAATSTAFFLSPQQMIFVMIFPCWRKHEACWPAISISSRAPLSLSHAAGQNWLWLSTIFPDPAPLQPAEKRLELCPFPITASSAIARHAEQSWQPIPILHCKAITEHHRTHLLDQTKDEPDKQSGASLS